VEFTWAPSEKLDTARLVRFGNRASCKSFLGQLESAQSPFRWRKRFLRDDIAAPDPVPSLAEFIGVASIGLEPVRDAPLLLAPVGQPTNLCRLHDETNRGRSAGIDDDDPPVADKSVDRASERDWIALRKRLDLDVLVDVCADVLGEPVNAPRVLRSRHDVL
jgi:hypothetical protein